MPTPEQIWADADLPARRLAGRALDPSVPESVLLRLLAQRADLGSAERRALVADPDPDVRTRVAYRADLDRPSTARS